MMSSEVILPGAKSAPQVEGRKEYINTVLFPVQPRSPATLGTLSGDPRRQDAGHQEITVHHRPPLLQEASHTLKRAMTTSCLSSMQGPSPRGWPQSCSAHNNKYGSPSSVNPSSTKSAHEPHKHLGEERVNRTERRVEMSMTSAAKQNKDWQMQAREWPSYNWSS